MAMHLLTSALVGAAIGGGARAAQIASQTGVRSLASRSNLASVAGWSATGAAVGAGARAGASAGYNQTMRLNKFANMHGAGIGRANMLRDAKFGASVLGVGGGAAAGLGSLALAHAASRYGGSLANAGAANFSAAAYAIGETGRRIKDGKNMVKGAAKGVSEFSRKAHTRASSLTGKVSAVKQTMVDNTKRMKQGGQDKYIDAKDGARNVRGRVTRRVLNATGRGNRLKAA
jgi:hypothetical protein